jgi:hypothetical protein
MLREKLIENGSCHDEFAQLYMMIGKYSEHLNLFYIGKTNGCVSDRLLQNDHLEKYNDWTKKHPRNKIHVSLGTIKLSEGRVNQRIIDDIETLLIYSHYNEDHKYMKNKKNIYSYNIGSDQYRLSQNPHYPTNFHICI